MRGTAAGDDVHAAVAVQVGRQGIFAGHAAVVDRMPVERERAVAAGLRSNTKTPGPLGPIAPGLFGSRWPTINSSSPSASRSAHQTAWPHCTRLGDHLAAPERCSSGADCGSLVASGGMYTTT